MAKEVTKKLKPVAELIKVQTGQVFEIDASELKILNFQFKDVEKDAELFLRCKGENNVQLGKGTDGNLIICTKTVFATLRFDGFVFRLISTCHG